MYEIGLAEIILRDNTQNEAKKQFVLSVSILQSKPGKILYNTYATVC